MAWRRLYLSLLLVRLYFALQPSYIHPDEHFQGPQVVAGEVFGWKVPRPWEFTTDKPIRSTVPLWTAYGMPMEVLRWISMAEPDPEALFYMLRTLFFILSFVVEDWALQELLPNSYAQHSGLLLTGSSYVTWTYQAHTFSNSIETIILLWALVLIKRIQSTKESTKESRWYNSALLGVTLVVGTFNRITFPAFLIIPGFPMLNFFKKNAVACLCCVFSGLACASAAVYMDTSIYTGDFPGFPFEPIITPLNNLIYNSATSNLAQHGLHPLYTHFLINLPQLLGPAFILVFTSLPACYDSPLFQSAVSGVAFLSLFRHQEARFLIPAVPLFLCSIKLPADDTLWQWWVRVWILFNAAYGTLMGVYHQGGVVPAQLFLSSNATELGLNTAVWWKTYHPPTWLLGPLNGIAGSRYHVPDSRKRVTTVDLMGAGLDKLVSTLEPLAGCSYNSTIAALNSTALHTRNYLVAPLSAVALDQYITIPASVQESGVTFHLEQIWTYSKHLHLDDMDFGDDGVWPTLRRVIGRRGIGVWEIVRNDCDSAGTKLSEIAKGVKGQIVDRIKEL